MSVPQAWLHNNNDTLGRNSDESAKPLALLASNFSIDQGGGKRRLCIAKMCLIEINASILTIRILFNCCDETPAWGAKRWQRQLTIGNGLKSASNGRAKPLITPCASNTPALAEFGLSRLRGLRGLAHSRRQNQK